tara:strand:+ start:219 stop:470 length:252 start_codon:yes stop_codon:yes gene_type:complete
MFNEFLQTENLNNKFKYMAEIENLINLHNDIKDSYIYFGIMSQSESKNFISIILDNIHFYNEIIVDDEDISDYDEDIEILNEN